MRVPKFAHSSGSTPTITLKDENFGRSQFASFAFHGSLALLLFMTFVRTRHLSRKFRIPTAVFFFLHRRIFCRNYCFPKTLAEIVVEGVVANAVLFTLP